MSGTAKTTAAPAAKHDFTPVMIYGIIADVLVLLPIILFIALKGPSGFATAHQTMISMLVVAWMPMAIAWIIGLVEDTPMSRKWIAKGMSMASMGGYGLHWVGLWTFMMSAFDQGAFTAWQTYIFLFIYLAINIGVVILEWFLSKGVFKWLKNAPFPTKAAAPAAKPAAKPAKKAAADAMGFADYSAAF